MGPKMNAQHTGSQHMFTCSVRAPAVALWGAEAPGVGPKAAGHASSQPPKKTTVFGTQGSTGPRPVPKGWEHILEDSAMDRPPVSFRLFSLVQSMERPLFLPPPHSAVGVPIPLLSPPLSHSESRAVCVWVGLFIWVTEGRPPCQIMSLKG